MDKGTCKLYHLPSQTGHVKCNTIKCPALACENPVTEPQRCCPKCSGMLFCGHLWAPDIDVHRFNVWDFSSSVEPRIPAGLRAPVKTCRHNGTVYQPGETFTNQRLFPSRHSNQCVMCTCSVSSIRVFILKKVF